MEISYKELKEKITPSMVRSIINIARDPTIIHKVEQIQGLIFNAITDEYWDECE